jgi:hypothetical protein
VVAARTLNTMSRAAWGRVGWIEKLAAGGRRRWLTRAATRASEVQYADVVIQLEERCRVYGLEGRIDSVPLDATKKRSPLVHTFVPLDTPCLWEWAAKPDGTLGEHHPLGHRGVQDDEEDIEARSDDPDEPDGDEIDVVAGGDDDEITPGGDEDGGEEGVGVRSVTGDTDADDEERDESDQLFDLEREAEGLSACLDSQVDNNNNNHHNNNNNTYTSTRNNSNTS